MKLVIQTQVYENYGDASNPHWKAKFGDDYWYDLGEYSRSKQAIAELIQFFGPRIESHSDYYREHIIYTSIESDAYLTPFEQDQLDYEGHITYQAKQLFIQDEVTA